MAELKLRNVTKKFGSVTALRDINLQVEDGQFVTLVGPSGCGKTTTIRIIAGLEEVNQGEVYIGRRRANDIPPQRRRTAMVFQSYALFPHMTVAANIAFGLKIKKVAQGQILDRIKWALELLDLQGLGQRRPRELSGGQCQRVALGRALVLDPEVLLLDEPLSNLDARLRLQMRTELKRIHKKIKSTIVYVTHDQTEAMTLSDRVAVMNNGILMQVGTPDQVYNFPDNMFVARFIGAPPMNFMPGRLTEENGGMLADLEDFTVTLPDNLARRLRRDSRAGEELILGIRPEDIHIKGSVTDAKRPDTIEAVVDVIEPLGSELILSLTSGKQEFQVTTSPDTPVFVDQKIEVVLNRNKIHLFDKKTQKNIGSGLNI